LDAPVQRVTGADIPMPYAKNLEDLSLPKPQQIAAVVKRMMGRA
jgi:pyruvate dehydrogenase E1 component beta subunit